ncbi:MAG: DegT/DnrJ/EryC1/StrS family aminotransferase [Candidatus Diapherotrites archaeon]|nr:DegT/DnrJ/EryC1/StrS family aminotransferase [Candidatus Diapherotrites archaeon]
MIPVCEPTLKGNELKYVTDCIESNWISSQGKYIEKFEDEFSKFCETKHGIGCCNGTIAIHLALEALGIGKGDEVIIPSFTMIGTSNAVIYSQAKPVLIDSEPETWNIDVNKIEEKITKKTKAIMPVHTYGHPVDMKPLLEIAEKHDLKVIEDAAEAHGAEYKGKRIGSLSDVACFSFYANKIITTGEGGMLTTNNEEIAEKAKLLRNHAFGKLRFVHEELGFNYRMTNIQAAIGLAQMEKAEELVNKRIKNAQIYNSMLKEVKGIITPPKKEWAKNVYWMYGILIKKEFGMSAEKLREELLKEGIDSRAFFIPMHQQPVYQKKDERFPDISGKYPVADMLSKEGFYLPSSSSLTETQIKEITEKIKSIKKKLK